MVVSKMFNIPHIYDMHSSLPQQLLNFQFTKSRMIIKLFKVLEKSVLKISHCVLTICPDLFQYVEKYFPDKGSVLIENVIDFRQAYDNREVVVARDIKVPVISIDDLIELKEKAGRERDFIDIKALKRIKELKSEM